MQWLGRSVVSVCQYVFGLGDERERGSIYSGDGPGEREAYAERVSPGLWQGHSTLAARGRSLSCRRRGRGGFYRDGSILGIVLVVAKNASIACP